MIDLFSPSHRFTPFFSWYYWATEKQNYSVTEIQTKLSATVIGQIFGPFMWEM